MHVNVPVWKEAPFVRIIPFFICGIAAEWYFKISSVFIVAGFLVFVLLFVLVSFLSISKKYYFRKVIGTLISSLLFFFGMAVCWKSDVRHFNTWYGNQSHSKTFLQLRICESPVEKTKTWNAVAEVDFVRGKKIIPVNGKLMLYFTKKDSFHLQYGSRIIIHAMPQQITNSGNPGAFDYKRYMCFKGIFDQIFLKGNDYVIVGKSNNDFYSFILSLRTNAISILEKYISGKDNLAIAEALMVGYKQELDKDLVQAYSNAGVVHIIAISGLHLGLVYILLSWILLRLPFIRKKKNLQWLIIIIGLWLFAFVTGCPPSALRSAVMFSFIITGKTFFRQHSTYNALCSSAFLLLCFDPYLLWDVGFQLSYAAVFGIVWLQPHINKLFYFRNKNLQKVWGLLSVTLAAQLITSPLCLYYFHQFPNFFLLTNIVAVPAVTVILFGGIILFCVSPLYFIASIIGKIISIIIHLLNSFILYLNQFDFAVTDNIYLSPAGAWLLYAIIILFAAGFFYRQTRFIPFAVFFLLLFSANNFIITISKLNQYKIIVYNIPGKKAIDFIKNDQVVFTGDTAMQHYGMLQNFHLHPARILSGINKINNYYTADNSFAVLFNNKIILNVSRNVYFKETVFADILIISDNPQISISAMNVSSPLIIFDSSNSLWKIEKWKSECEKLHLRCYSVPHSGAFIL